MNKIFNKVKKISSKIKDKKESDNTGFKNELRVKCYLLYCILNEINLDKLFKIFNCVITNISNNYNDYCSNNFDLEKVKTIDKITSLKEYLKKFNIICNGNNSKLDMIIKSIKNLAVSIKSEGSALMNRSRIEDMAYFTNKKNVSYTKENLDILEDFINNYYWPLREKGLISSRFYFSKDFKLINLTEEYMRELKLAFRNILYYYAFVGSASTQKGKGDSLYPADFLLEVIDPFDLDTYKFFSKEQFMTDDKLYDEIFYRLILQIRTETSKKIIKNNSLSKIGRFFDDKMTQLIQINLGKRQHNEK